MTEHKIENTIGGITLDEDGDPISDQTIEVAPAVALTQGGVDVDGSPREVPAGKLFAVQEHGAAGAIGEPSEPCTHDEALAMCQDFNEGAAAGQWFGVVSAKP